MASAAFAASCHCTCFQIAQLLVSSHPFPSRRGEDIRSLIGNTSVRKAVGHSVCVLSFWIRVKNRVLQNGLMVHVVCQQKRASSFQGRDENL